MRRQAMYKIKIDTPNHEQNLMAIKKYRSKDIQKFLDNESENLINSFTEYTDNCNRNKPRQQNHLWTYDKNWKDDDGTPKPLGNIMYDCYGAKLKMLSDYKNKLLYDEGYIEGLCPICGADTTSIDWDHYAPRSKFPELSLLYANLIPICHRCNDKKGDYWPVDIADIEIYNAYYGDIPTQKMLDCAINITNGFPYANVILLNISNPDNSTKIALYTINKLKLLEVFNFLANKELVRIRKDILRHKKVCKKSFDDLWITETKEMQSIIDDVIDVNDIRRVVCEGILKDDTFKNFIENN